MGRREPWRAAVFLGSGLSASPSPGMTMESDWRSQSGLARPVSHPLLV